MNHLAIVRVISTIALGFSGLFLAAFLVALASGEAAQQMVFAGAGATVGGFGGTVLLLTDKPKRRAHARDGLAVAIAGFMWAVRSGQFDELDSQGWRVLIDSKDEEGSDEP